MGKIDLSTIRRSAKPVETSQAQAKLAAKQYIAPEPPAESAAPNDLLRSLLKPPRASKKKKRPSKSRKHEDPPATLQDNPRATELQTQKKKILADTYIREFPEKLEKFQKVKTDKLSAEELDELISSLRAEVNSSSSLAAVAGSAGLALGAYEYVLTNLLGINVTGISNLAASPEFRDTLKATLLKYLGGSLTSVVEPEMKLAYSILSTSVILYMHNTAEPSAPSIPSNTPSCNAEVAAAEVAIPNRSRSCNAETSTAPESRIPDGWQAGPQHSKADGAASFQALNENFQDL